MHGKRSSSVLDLLEQQIILCTKKLTGLVWTSHVHLQSVTMYQLIREFGDAALLCPILLSWEGLPKGSEIEEKSPRTIYRHFASLRETDTESLRCHILSYTNQFLTMACKRHFCWTEVTKLL